MSLLDILTRADGKRTVDADGNLTHLVLKPGLSELDQRAFEAGLPCSLPQDVREALRFTRGFKNGPIQEVDFSGLGDFELEELFACPIAIAQDEAGNRWIVDLTPDSIGYGPVWFVSHDPAVIVYQCADVSEFVTELLKLANPPHESALADVQRSGAARIWSERPGERSIDDCLAGGDAVLASFAMRLDPSWIVVDLRDASQGDGFAWGRFGPRTTVERCGSEPVFAYRPAQRSWLRRLRGA